MQVTEQELAELEATMPSQEERDQMRTDEDDAEADKKAEYTAMERDFVDNIFDLQHGNAVYPIGRDRMYRRYWMFKSIPGVFIEDDEQYVATEALQLCCQNPLGSTFDLNNPMAVPPKLNFTKTTEIPQQGTPEQQSAPVLNQENKEGSDKENDSMNASSLNNSAVTDVDHSSPNIQSANNSLVNTDISNKTENSVDKENGQKTESDVDKDNGDAIVVISDDDDSRPPMLQPEEKIQPPLVVETPALKQITEIAKHACKWAFYRNEEELDLLIASLNGRGFRERALKMAILEQKNKIMDTISKVEVDLLHIPEEAENDVTDDNEGSSKLMTKEWKRGRRNVTGMMHNDSAHEGLELNLREMILDLEERIHVGSLGHLRVSTVTGENSPTVKEYL